MITERVRLLTNLRALRNSQEIFDFRHGCSRDDHVRSRRTLKCAPVWQSPLMIRVNERQLAIRDRGDETYEVVVSMGGKG